MNTISYTYTTYGDGSFVNKTVFKGSYIHIESIQNSYILPMSLVQFSRGDFAMGGVVETVGTCCRTAAEVAGGSAGQKSE
jgi:hypothetical protein